MTISTRKKRTPARRNIDSAEPIVNSRRNWQPRGRTLDAAIEEHFPFPRKRTEYLHPYPEDSSVAEDMVKAIRRAGREGVVECSAGEYEPILFDKQAQILCVDTGGRAQITGGIKVKGTTVMFRGFTIQAEVDKESVLELHQSVVICDGCDLVGAVHVGAGSRLYLRNCTIQSGAIGVTVAPGGFLEASGSRITGSETGISVQKGSEISLYGCRFDDCKKLDGTGACLRAQGANLYFSGCEFFENDLGIVIAESPTRIMASHFDDNKRCSISADASHVEIYASLIGGPDDEAPVVCKGGSLRMEDTLIFAPQECVQAHDCEMEIFDSLWEKDDGTVSALGKADKPVADTSDSKDSGEKDSSMQRAEAHLDRIIGQPLAREKMQSILQFAWAASHRPTGLGQRLAITFVGQPKSGQQRSVTALSAALKEIGVLKNEKTLNIQLSTMQIPDTGLEKYGVFFFSLPVGEKFFLSRENSAQLLQIINSLPEDALVIVETNDEKFRALVTRHAYLRRLFSHEVFFPNLEPVDLLTYFAEMCEAENIMISRDAARKLIIIINSLYEGFARRYSDTDGIEELFLSIRRQFLSRVAASMVADDELMFDDIEIPTHRRAIELCGRSAEFVQFCPVCSRTTPWLPGMADHIYCIVCGSKLPMQWGIVRGSEFHQRVRTANGKIESAGVGAVAARLSTS